MTQLFELIIWIFRRGPIGLGVLAALILGAGFFLQVMQNKTHAENAIALAAGPPAVVGIADAVDTKSEVVIQAELLFDHGYDLWFEKDFGTDYVVMYPLIAAGSPNTDRVLGVVMLEAKDDTFETLSNTVEQASYVSEGKFGPVMNLNGELDDFGQWRELVEESFYDEGLTLPENPIVIWPYVEGRDVALAPPDADDMTIFGLLSKIGGAFGLIALGKLVFGSKSRGDKTPEPQPLMAETPIAPEPQTAGVPLWKQRAGLVDPSDHDPTPSRATPIAAPTMAPVTTPKRSGFGVRKVLIGIVGCLFLIGLVSVVTDLIMESSANSTVTVASSEDLAAATVADALVPDADPNRHWTDIDVTPVIEWVVAKFFLAVSGDTDAQITLGMIFGGLFIGMFVLRVYITARLTSTLSRRRSYNFDDLTSGG